MELFIKGNGNMNLGMVTGFKFGQMVQNMKDNGKIMLLMVKENFGMQMVMFMMETGKMIKLMDLAPTHI